MRAHLSLLLLPLLALAACDDVKEDEHDHHHDHNHGLTTALVMHFTDATGDTLTFSWEDPENDGVDVKIDEVVLAAGTTYDLELQVLNQLEDPVEDVTGEILEHADEHQFFFTGDVVVGPASDAADAFLEHAYADTDDNGLPIGVDNVLTAFDTGSGELTVTLRHMPAEGSAIKVDGVAETVATDGFGAIGGDNDIQVTFPVLSE